MSSRFFLLSVFPLILGLSAQAQETLLQEDFESGFPATWWTAGTSPQYWHVADPGECGAVTHMAAYNSGPGNCAYTTYSFSTAGVIACPYLLFTARQPLEVSFDYRLDVDWEEITEVAVVPADGSSWGEYVIGDLSNFINDGALHSATLTASGAHPQLGDGFRVEWRFSSDTSGNQGFGWMVDNVRITQYPTAIPHCFGDGSGMTCPCANNGAPGGGCAHSGGFGAFLEGTGSASVTLDELVFRGTQLKPGQSALLFQGNNAVNGGLGNLFGDGLRCAGGGMIRLGVKAADVGGGAMWGPGLSGAGGWSAGQTRYFQAWYRDPVGSPCGMDFNLTNGSSVTFIP